MKSVRSVCEKFMIGTIYGRCNSGIGVARIFSVHFFPLQSWRPIR